MYFGDGGSILALHFRLGVSRGRFWVDVCDWGGVGGFGVVGGGFGAI